MAFVNTVDIIGDEALTASIIGRSITEIADNIITSIGKGAFFSCAALTKAELIAATSSSPTCFYECVSLVEVNLPLLENLANQAFYSCKALKKVSVPVAKSIGSQSFYNCGLEKIEFHSLESIGGNAFASCYSLKTIILRNETMCTLSDASAFMFTPIYNKTGYIYVPRALVDTYKEATNWSTYAARFRALEDYTVDGTITGELDPTKI